MELRYRSRQLRISYLVSQISSANITIFTVGLLQQSNNTTMQDLATKTGGQFYYVTTSNDLLSTFQKSGDHSHHSHSMTKRPPSLQRAMP